MVTYKLPHKEFNEALKSGKLMGFKCNSCGAYTCPPKINCNECASMDMVVVEFKGRAEIKSYTIIRVSPEGFEGVVPYIVALAQLEEGPNLVGNLVGVDPDKVTDEIIGKKVKIGCKPAPPNVKYCGPIGKDGKLTPEMVAITFSLM
jgi:hypothetical protein